MPAAGAAKRVAAVAPAERAGAVARLRPGRSPCPQSSPTSATDRATSAASSVSAPRGTTSPASPTSRCTRSSTAGRSPPASRPPRAATSWRCATRGSSTRCSTSSGCARCRARWRSATCATRPPAPRRGRTRSRSGGRIEREIALAHNGNLINAVELHGELRARGVAFRSTSDSEIIAALLSTHEADSIEDALEDVMRRIEGAYSTVVMSKDRVVAFRDPAGLRPLSLGMLGDRYVVASETCAFDIIGGTFLRDVQPGEIVSLTPYGLQTRMGVGELAAGPVRVRAHLLRAARFAARRPGAAGGARADGGDPRARGAGLGRPRDPGAGLRQPGRARLRAAPAGCRRTTG